MQVPTQDPAQKLGFLVLLGRVLVNFTGDGPDPPETHSHRKPRDFGPLLVPLELLLHLLVPMASVVGFQSHHVACWRCAELGACLPGPSPCRPPPAY